MKRNDDIHILAIVDSARDVGLGHIKRTDYLISQWRFPGKMMKVSYLVENNSSEAIFQIQPKAIKVNLNDSGKLFKGIESINKLNAIDVFVKQLAEK